MLINGKHVVSNGTNTVSSIINFNKLYTAFELKYFKGTKYTIMYCPEISYNIFWHESNLSTFPYFNTEMDRQLQEGQLKLIKDLNAKTVIMTYSSKVLKYLKSIKFKHIIITRINMDDYNITYEEACDDC